MKRLNMFRWVTIPLLLLLLGGCSGGSGSGSSPTTVSGVAAAGSPVSGTVYLKDSSLPAKELSAPINSDGSFTFDVTGLVPPYLLKASGTVHQVPTTLYSLSPYGGTVHINPLSGLALALAHRSDDLDSLYSNADPLTLRDIRSALKGAVLEVQTALRPTLEKFGAAGADFMSGPYVADHRGLDLFLDLVSVSSANGMVTLLGRQTHTGAQRPLAQFAADMYDIAIPEVPAAGTLYALPAENYVFPGGSCRFVAFLIGSKSPDFSWSVVEDNGGSVTNDGVYTAPQQPGVYHVRVTSIVDPSKRREMTVTVKEPENVITVLPAGPGVFTVMGQNIVNVTGAELEFTYDTKTLANPRINMGNLAMSTLFLGNPNFSSDRVKVTFMTLAPIFGSGTVATLSFDVVGASPGGVTINKNVLVGNTAIPINPVTSGGTANNWSGNGDVNADGVVRLADSLMALRFIAGTQVPTIEQTTACNITGDVIIPSTTSEMMQPNCDIYDATLIIRKAYGIQ